MSEAYTGGCACGAIRYEISGEPLVMNDCQCRDCQRKSGTGQSAAGSAPSSAGGAAVVTATATRKVAIKRARLYGPTSAAQPPSPRRR